MRNILQLRNGVHFIEHRTCNGASLTTVLFTNGVFVTSGGPGILFSHDGTNWTTIASSCSVPVSPMRYADGRWMAFCDSNFISSVDGSNWTTTPAPCADFSITVLQYANGLWVAGCGNIISSVDGTNWNVQVPNAGYLSDLIHGGNRWVACGWNGLIWSSPDGLHWQNCSVQTAASLGPIAFRDGLFSIYSAAGYLISETSLVSSDGLRWLDASKTGPLLAIARAELSNTWILSLAGNWGHPYSLQDSSDLVHWTEFQTITNSSGVTSLEFTNFTGEAALFVRAAAK